MILKNKLKKRKKIANIAWGIIFIASIHLVMIFVRCLYFWTKGSTIGIIANIHSCMFYIISKIYRHLISYLWIEIVPYIPLDGKGVILLYKMVIPPAVIIIICSLFIRDYRSLKATFRSFNADVDNELSLREMQKQSNIDVVYETAAIDVVINNAINSNPSWYAIRSGKIIIGVAIATLTTTFFI